MTVKFIVLAVAAFGVLAPQAFANDRAIGTDSVATQANETRVRNKLDQLSARLEALNQETRRRMKCQQETKVSNASGCVVVPGLEQYIQSRI